jgi:hypothetical protein
MPGRELGSLRWHHLLSLHLSLVQYAHDRRDNVVNPVDNHEMFDGECSHIHSQIITLPADLRESHKIPERFPERAVQ